MFAVKQEIPNFLLNMKLTVYSWCLFLSQSITSYLKHEIKQKIILTLLTLVVADLLPPPLGFFSCPCFVANFSCTKLTLAISI